jgi:CHAT domain-containing protein
LGIIGLIHQLRGEGEKALASYQSALDVACKIGSPMMVAKAQDTMGRFLSGEGEIAKALGFHERALAIYREIGNSMGEASALCYLGGIFAALQQYAKAFENFRASLKLAEEAGAEARRADVLTRMGGVFLTFGRIEEAEKACSEAMEILKRLGTPLELSSTVILRVRIHFSRGEVKEGLARVESLLQFFRERGMSIGIKSSLFMKSIGHFQNQETQEALESVEASLRISDHLGQEAKDQQILRAFLFDPTPEKKKEGFGHKGRFAALLCPLSGAVEEEMRGKGYAAGLQECISMGEAALDVLWGGGTVPGNGKRPWAETVSIEGPWGAVPEATRTACRESKFLDWSYLEVGFQLTESLRAREFIWEMQVRGKLLSNAVRPDLLKALQNAEGRLNATRKDLFAAASGKSLYDALGKPLDEKERKERIETLRREMRKELEVFDRTHQSIREAHPSLEALESIRPVRLQTLQDTLSEDEMFLEYVCTGQGGRLHRLRIGEGDRTRELALARTERKSSGKTYLLAVTKKEASVHGVGTTRILADCVELFRMTIDAQRWCSATKDYVEQARSLYADLLGPVLKGLGEDGGKTRHLIISPDGPLARLSFDALLAGAPPEGGDYETFPYLMRRFSTEYTPSATAWVHMRKGKFRRGEPGSRFVALADPDYGDGIREEALRSTRALAMPLLAGGEEEKKTREAWKKRLAGRLSPEVQGAWRKAEGTRGSGVLGALPGTRREVKSIAPLFQKGWLEGMAIESLDEGKADPKPQQAQVFFGRGAREIIGRDPERLLNAEVLHFACHGVADDLTPAEASVILTTEGLPEEEDGFLTASEVMGLRTNAKVVVLSACETGLGRIIRGEGVQGLTRAWQFAGARTVVVSLWKVDDRATAAFMKAFYEAYRVKGAGVTEALARARREMTAVKRTAAPVYWAAFTGHGER